MTKKPIKIKAWALVRNNKICHSFGNCYWVFSTKDKARLVNTMGFENIPVTITYSPSKGKGNKKMR